MPLIHEDFGESIISYTINDTFFLDANFIVATADESNKYHKACKNLLKFFIEEETVLYVSNTVITESVHVLARAIYIDNSIEAARQAAIPSEETDYELKRKFGARFSNLGKNGRGTEDLRECNSAAIQIIEDFLAMTIIEILPTTEAAILESFKLGINTPLHSADAAILAVVVSNPDIRIKGVISLDQDMIHSPINIYSTNVINKMFDDSIYK